MDQDQCTYVRSVVEGVSVLSRGATSDGVNRILSALEAALRLALLDLTPAAKLLRSHYANRKGGRRPRDPVAMLRSVVLMGMMQVRGPNAWVQAMKLNPVLAVLSGFAPYDPPAVGTFYEFFHRLLNGPYKRRCDHTKRPYDHRRGCRSRYRRNLKQEKAARKALKKAAKSAPDEGRVKTVVDGLLSGLGPSLKPDLTTRLHEILMRCAVAPTAARGLLGDLSRLVISGDGSLVASGANPNGKRLCTCGSEDGTWTHCDCDRQFSDPTATWGYSATHDKYVFGHRVHVLSTKCGGNDLPLHVAVAQAHEVDAVMGARALFHLVESCKEWGLPLSVAYAVFDAGYDATAFYKGCLHHGATPIIPLHNEAKTPFDRDGHPRDENGVPLCPGGAAMWRHSFNKNTEKIVYACPAKRPSQDGIRVDMTRCPNGALCDPQSKMGPTFNVSVADDPRLNPPIGRDTETWKRLFAERTSAERIFSSAKAPGRLAERSYRRDHVLHIALLGHALDCHARAWVKQQFPELPTSPEGLIAALESLLPASAEVACAA